jgi:hypothetical protein
MRDGANFRRPPRTPFFATPPPEKCRLAKQENRVGKFFKSLRGKDFGQNPKRFFVIRIARETDNRVERR